MSGNKYHIIIWIALTLVITGCGLFTRAQSPQEKPTPVAPPKEETAVVDQPRDTARKIVKDTVGKFAIDKTKKWNKKSIYSVCMVLPFSTDAGELEKLLAEENITGYQPLAAVEFYEGALMALDTLDSLHINLDIQVFNHFKDSSLTAALFSKPEIRNTDVIIGPVFNEGLKAASVVAQEEEIFLVSPLSPMHQFTDSNRYFLMANPPAVSQIEEMLSYAQDSFATANIICVYRTDKPIEAKLAQEFKDAFQHVNKGRMQLHETYTFSGVSDALQAQGNYVFIASFDELYTNGLIRDLSKISRTTPLTLMGLPHVLSFESVSIDYYENLHFTYPASYYIDRLAPKVRDFENAFAAKYETRPSDYACRGYDMMLYIGMMLNTYGPDLGASAASYNPAERYMLFPFHFAPVLDTNGNIDHMENTTIRILRFDQFRFEVVNQ